MARCKKCWRMVAHLTPLWKLDINTLNLWFSKSQVNPAHDVHCSWLRKTKPMLYMSWFSRSTGFLNMSLLILWGFSPQGIGYNILDMRKLSTKLVPKFLNTDQKCSRMTSKAILDQFVAGEADCIVHLITMDETWLHQYDHWPSSNQWSDTTAVNCIPRNFGAKS